MIGGFLMVTEGSCQIIWAIYLRYISVDCYYFVYFASALSITASILTIFIPESPRYLYGANQLEECANVLKKLAKYNGVVGYDDPKFDPDVEILIQNLDETNSPRASGNQAARKTEEQFDHLLGRPTSGREGTAATEKAQNGRYITQARKT